MIRAGRKSRRSAGGGRRRRFGRRRQSNRHAASRPLQKRQIGLSESASFTQLVELDSTDYAYYFEHWSLWPPGKPDSLANRIRVRPISFGELFVDNDLIQPIHPTLARVRRQFFFSQVTSIVAVVE